MWLFSDLTFVHYVFQKVEFYLSKVEQQPCISTMMALLPLIKAFDHRSNFKAWKWGCESFSCRLVKWDRKDYRTKCSLQWQSNEDTYYWTTKYAKSNSFLLFPMLKVINIFSYYIFIYLVTILKIFSFLLEVRVN